jgi:hypothetical protein
LPERFVENHAGFGPVEAGKGCRAIGRGSDKQEDGRCIDSL